MLTYGVDAGQRVVEADRGSVGDAGAKHGDAVADPCSGGDDEHAGEVIVTQSAAAVDEQAGPRFEGMDAAGTGAQRLGEPTSVLRKKAPNMGDWVLAAGGSQQSADNP